MQHNAVLLVGLLARASVAFRRRFAADTSAMEALLEMLGGSDTGTLRNVIWALRSLSAEGILRDISTRRAAVSSLRSLSCRSQDQSINIQAKDLATTLQRPCPIDTNDKYDDEAAAAAGLASIMHTPPPRGQPEIEIGGALHLGVLQHQSDEREGESGGRKRKATSPDVSNRVSRRLSEMRRRVFAEDEESLLEAAEEANNMETTTSLSFLIQAAEG